MKQFLNRLLGRTAKSLPAPIIPATTPPLTDDQHQAQHLLEQGHALEDAGQPAAAETLYLQALTLCPHWSRIALNLGNALAAQGRFEEAITRYEEALRLEPSYGAAHANLGKIYLTLGRHQLAADHYTTAAHASPHSAEVLVGLGCSLEELQCHAEAEQAYRQALALQPDSASAQLNLGRLLILVGQIELDQQHFLQALERYTEAVKVLPKSADGWSGLGFTFHNLGYYHKAEHAYQTALTIDPKHIIAQFHLGRLLVLSNQPDEAIKYLREVLASKSDHWPSLIWLSKAMIDTALISYALKYIDKAEQLQPNRQDIASMKLYTMNYLPTFSTEELFSAHLDFAQRFCAEFYPKSLQYKNSCDPNRPLKIGYVSADFRNHAVATFIETVFGYHDNINFEIHAFYNYHIADAITEHLKNMVDQWHPIYHLDDVAAEQLIRNLDIDILVDLSGHSEFNRLQLFARKPAPLQVTWLGYLGTTGLATMDYRLCDLYTDPLGLTEQFHTEQLARLPDCQWCYSSYIDLPPISELPLLRNNYLTLGSFNYPAKLNDQVLELWARILNTIPKSHLRIAAISSGQAQERIASILNRADIARDRLEFTPRIAYRDYLASIADVDIALDPFPYNGGTTSIDILIMGVPVVTLAGDRSISRGGVSLLSNLDLAELIAKTLQDYVNIVQQLANDPIRLKTLRESLRGRVQTSPLMDGERFTNNLEALYRQIWHQWCTASAQRHSQENS